MNRKKPCDRKVVKFFEKVHTVMRIYSLDAKFWWLCSQTSIVHQEKLYGCITNTIDAQPLLLFQGMILFTSFLFQANGVVVYKIPQWYVIVALGLDDFIMVSLSHKQKLINDCVSQSCEIAIGTVFSSHCLKILVGTALLDLRGAIRHQLVTQSQMLRCIGVVSYKAPKLEHDQRLKEVKDMSTAAEMLLMQKRVATQEGVHILEIFKSFALADEVIGVDLSNSFPKILARVPILFNFVYGIASYGLRPDYMINTSDFIHSHYVKFSCFSRAKLSDKHMRF